MARRRGTARQQSSGLGGRPTGTATQLGAGIPASRLAGATPPAAPAAPAAAAPTPPAAVTPFPTAEDMLAVNDWLTNWQTQMEDIDYGITQQTMETESQKGANKKQAVEQRSASDDVMAARGIFSSSLRDAATYDIEATRALNDTALDNRLQAAVTAASTRKGTLATAKTNFEAGMAAKYGENARSVNDALNAGYAEALANYTPPKALAPPATKPATVKPPVVVASRPQQQPAKVRVGTVVGKPVTGLGTAKPKRGLGNR